jgi:hypothetical protein
MRASSPHEHASTLRRSPYRHDQSPLTAHSQEEWTRLRPSFYHETAAGPSSSDTGPGASQPAWRWAETDSGDGPRGVGDGGCISAGGGCLAGGNVDGGPGGTHDSVAGLRVAGGYGAGAGRREHSEWRAGPAGRPADPSHPSLHCSEGALAGACAGACQWPGPGLSPAVEDSDDSDLDGPAGREWAEYWAKEALPGSLSRVP